MEKKAKEQALSGMHAGKIDFKSEGFQRIFQWILKEVDGACSDISLTPATTKMFFGKLQQRMLGFEDVAKGIYHGDTKKKKKTQQVTV